MTRRALNTVAGAIFVTFILGVPWVLGVALIVIWTIRGATGGQ